MQCFEMGPGREKKLAGEAISLVQQTWEQTGSVCPVFAELLQQNLQNSGSTLRPLPSMDRAIHRVAVFSMLDSIMQGLPNIQVMAYFSHQLRQLYVGVKSIQQFAADMGAAWILTVEQILHSELSTDARRAWVDACDVFEKSLLSYMTPVFSAR